MACGCKKAGVAAAVNAPENPDDFPATDAGGEWLVQSAGGAAYAFATLADARTAADMISGTITSR